MMARGNGVALVAAVALGVSACGGSSPSGRTTTGNGEAAKSGKQVVRDAMGAALGASSFRESGHIGQTAFDLTILKGDKGVSGSVTNGGQKVEVMVVGNRAYTKAPAAYWKQHGPAGRTIAHLAADKWTRFSLRSRWFWPWKDYAGTTPQLFYSLREYAAKMTNRGATTYNGHRVINIDVASRDTLYVSATGTPYPVALIKTGGGSSLTFDRWNEPVTLTAPPNAVDISKR